MKKSLFSILLLSVALNAAESNDDLVARRARIVAFKAAAKANGTYDPMSEKYRDGLLAAANVEVVPSKPIVLSPEQIKRGNSFIKLRAFVAGTIKPITNKAEYDELHAQAQEIYDRREQFRALGRKSSAFLELARTRLIQFSAQQSNSQQ